MKTILIASIILECLLLALLTIFQKWTKKAFLIVAAVTAVCCFLLYFLNVQTERISEEADQRACIYISARLIQEKEFDQSLQALAEVSDTDSARYGSSVLRGLSYNLNEAFYTAETYLRGKQNSGQDAEADPAADLQNRVLEASTRLEKADQALQDEVTQKVLELVNASAEETAGWETELKVRYLGLSLEEDRETDYSRLIQVRNAVNNRDYGQAWQIMHQDGISTKDSILVSQMFVYGYDNRTMADADEEYSLLWAEQAKLQADLNEASIDMPGNDNDYFYSETETETDPELKKQRKEYQLLQARHSLAGVAIAQETDGRAVNYLKAAGQSEGQTAGYHLQLANLYFQSNQYDKARESLAEVFLNGELGENEWLGREINDFREAFVIYLSDPGEAEYSFLFKTLMDSLYQGVFEESADSAFMEFVTDWLRDQLGGIAIRKVDASEYPMITVEATAIDEDLVIDEGSVNVRDTGTQIEDFTVEQEEVTSLSLAFVLDRSGSMSGSNIADSKAAIRSCIQGLSDDVMVSLTTFESNSTLDCPLTGSKYTVLNQVEGIEADGGTNIASGLSTAIDSLAGASGSKVIILLSDGVDSSESSARIDSIVAEASMRGITVYTIGLPGCDEAYLQRISDQTGGQFIMVTDTAELNKVYSNIQKSVMNTYKIIYSVQDEEEHRNVQVQSSAGTARAVKKYSSMQEPEETSTFENGDQQASYFKQTGGSMGGR